MEVQDRQLWTMVESLDLVIVIIAIVVIVVVIIFISLKLFAPNPLRFTPFINLRNRFSYISG